MVSPNLLKSDSTPLTNNTKVLALETSLNQSLVNFQDLVSDFQRLHIETEDYKSQFLTVKEKCEHKICTAAEELKKIISIKDQIIQSVASTLTKLNETKDFTILAEAFKILFEEVTPLTPPTDTLQKNEPCSSSNNSDSSMNKNPSQNKSNSYITEDVSYNEESMCEIEGTPTGRTSPIIQTRKAKSGLAKTDVKDKKKTLDDGTPKGGKLRQARLNLVTVKPSTVVDLTCSPEILAAKLEHTVQPLIKKESVEEDTILPSPTSGPTHISLFKSSKASPSKFKKPKLLSLKSKNRQDENKDSNNASSSNMDESINILNQFSNRIRDMKKENSLHKDSFVKKEMLTPTKRHKTPTKKEKHTLKLERQTAVKKEIDSEDTFVADEDATNASIAIHEFEQLEQDRNMRSSEKRPLVENINISNTPPQHDAEASLSVLRPEHNIVVEPVKRKLELVEPVYKEPTVRRKAEKRNLQGWSCDKCRNFYGSLYKDDPELVARKVEQCSHHRGRHDPARPGTPPNFWNPRWTVPTDTEELNRMNGVD